MIELVSSPLTGNLPEVSNFDDFRLALTNEGLLVTGGDNKVADQSAWTVIVAKSIEMHGGPNLVVNANYGGSPVPVPKGVGPATETHLVQ